MKMTKGRIHRLLKSRSQTLKASSTSCTGTGTGTDAIPSLKEPLVRRNNFTKCSRKSVSNLLTKTLTKRTVSSSTLK